MQLNNTTRFNEDCICERGSPKVLDTLVISKTRTNLICTRCRGIVGWWDFESNFKLKSREERGIWSQEELATLYKPAPKKNPLKREWSEKELEELV